MSVADVFAQLGGIVPFAPDAMLFPQVTEQPEFLPGTRAYAIQQWIEARGWDWRLVCEIAPVGLILMQRPDGSTEMALCPTPAIEMQEAA